MSKKWIVITTINPPTEAIESISRLCTNGWSAVVVGDRKTPKKWNAPGIDYLSVEAQASLFGGLSDAIPFNHYCRKNLGYLYAISHGAEVILETDDDNIPYDSFGMEIQRTLTVPIVGGAHWINIYKYFTDEHIWPRGLPLDEIRNAGRLMSNSSNEQFPIQQYLADLDPDVDAVYRLAIGSNVTFNQNSPVGIDRNCWVPFNSQNTLFAEDAFWLLYLPCHVSFRMTDIWRSFVAQQALWIHGFKVAFRPATVKQLRNEHDLMRDFSDELPGYLSNKKIITILGETARTLSPDKGLPATALALWRALIENGIVPKAEEAILASWMEALATLKARSTKC